ncbi:MAG: hypothetical protein ABIP51_17835 [Bacteroidia bacterium]
MKVASIIKVKSKYELVYWIMSLPWKVDALKISDLIEEAKSSEYVLWSIETGFVCW